MVSWNDFLKEMPGVIFVYAGIQPLDPAGKNINFQRI
jgi:hypothetical protein